MSMIYIAAPIDQAAGTEGAAGIADRKHQIRQQLRRYGIGSYDPAAAFIVGQGQQPTRELANINNFALGRSAGMVALLPPGVPTIGTPMEIERAAHNGKPVLIVGGDGSWELAKYQNWQHVLRTDWGSVGQQEQGLDWLLDQITAGVGRIAAAEPLLFKQLREQSEQEHAAALPRRAHEGDAGYDLHVSQTTEIKPGEMVDVPCNLAVQLPEWAWGLLVGRSSTLRTKRLQVHPGIVDSGYRGELFAAVSTLSDEPVVVSAGDRLAQLIVMSNQSRLVRPQWSATLDDTDRGTRGFGSTGV
ncbi:MAG TPA: hypothetical protein VFT75_18520 [Nocardioidaceae bacterium]|nr:hypothetical protein [Nocardioidaceae bacterium]